MSGNQDDDPPGPASKHRRAETRRRVSGRARLKDGPEVRILDVSSTGILFRCDEDLDRNTTVVLEFTGPHETTWLPALVVRSRPMRSPSFDWYEIACRLKRPHALEDLLRLLVKTAPPLPKKTPE